jgi:RNA polymerase sigma factor (TIGR02999 family)
MRRILTENARRKACVKRGGGLQRVDLDDLDLPVTSPPEQLLALDEAIEKLSGEDEAAASLIKSMYFAGLTIEQAAAVLGISVATAYRHWAYARAWLHCDLNREED